MLGITAREVLRCVDQSRGDFPACPSPGALHDPDLDFAKAMMLPHPLKQERLAYKVRPYCVDGRSARYRERFGQMVDYILGRDGF